MKKFFLAIIFIIFFLVSLRVEASHIMGADITYECLGGDQYEVVLTVYRDCEGIDLSQTQDVDIESASCNLSQTVTMQLDSKLEVSQLCPTAVSSCVSSSSSLPGTEAWIYTATVTMQPCTDWIIYWSDCCRNASISNLQTPSTRDIYVQATMNNVDAPCNNSPTYLAVPTPYLCVNQLAIYNHGASDIDGDSLSYSFANPLELPGPPGTNIPFTGGYSMTNPIITTSGVNLDQETGELCFTPSQAQICVLAMKIEQYRNNILVGSQVREMQVVISAACTNQAPFSGTSPTCGQTGSLVITNQGTSVQQLDANSLQMCPFDSLCFEIDFSDPDGDNVTVNSNIATAIPGAVFNVVGQGTPNPIGTFCWVPTPLDSGLNIITFHLEDDACPISASQYYTYDITVFDRPYAGLDQTICGPNGAQLQALGGSNYSWSVLSGEPINVGTNFTCVNCPDPVANPTVTTTYILTSGLAAQCANTDTVTVHVIPGFSLDLTDDTLLCELGSIPIEAIASGGSGTYTYTWETNATLSDTSIYNPIATPNYTSTYYLELDAGGCLIYDSVVVTVVDKPDIVLLPLDTAICDGDTLDFSLAISAFEDDFDGGYQSSLWSSVDGEQLGSSCGAVSGDALMFNGISTRQLSTISLDVTNCTNIDYSLFLGNASSGTCENVDNNEDVYLRYSIDGGVTWVDIVTHLAADWDVNPNWQSFSTPIPPAAQTPGTMFRWEQDNFSTSFDNWAIDEVQLGCSSSNAYTYLWSPATSLSDPTVSDPKAFPSTSTNYVVTMTNAITGCSYQDSIEVTISNDLFVNTIQSDTLICLNDTVNFVTAPSSVGTYEYEWLTNGVATYPDSNKTDIYFDQAGIDDSVFVKVSSGGCFIYDTLFVDISKAPMPVTNILTPQLSIACGDTTQIDINLNAPDSLYSISWTPLLGLTDATIGAPKAFPVDDTEYFVTIVDSTGHCATTDSIEVVVGCCLAELNSSQPPSCVGVTDGYIETTVFGLHGPYDITWFDVLSGSQIRDTSAVVLDTLNNIGAGDYRLLITDANGCVIDTQLVLLDPPPIQIVTKTQDTTLCIDAVIAPKVIASGGVAPYEINWGSGFTPFSPTLYPVVDTALLVTVMDSQGCTSVTDTIFITILDSLTIEPLLDDTVCIGDAATISPVVGGGNGAYQYVWYNQDGTLHSKQKDLVVAPTTSPEVYYVKVNDLCQTPDTYDTVAVYLRQIAPPVFIADSLSGCYPLGIDFSATNVGPGSKQKWHFGDGSTFKSLDSAVAHTYQYPGCFDVKLEVTTIHGCLLTVEKPEYICARDYPVASFSSTPEETDVLNPYISFINETYGNNTYQWVFDQGIPALSTKENPRYVEYSDTDPATYQVTLAATNEYGCTDTIVKYVDISPIYIFNIPNSFTPDEDDINDYFFPRGENIDPSSFVMTIYDRLGHVVYTSTKYGRGWDGKDLKGNKLPNGNYIWTIEITEDFNKSVKHKTHGSVTLLR